MFIIILCFSAWWRWAWWLSGWLTSPANSRRFESRQNWKNNPLKPFGTILPFTRLTIGAKRFSENDVIHRPIVFLRLNLTNFAFVFADLFFQKTHRISYRRHFTIVKSLFRIIYTLYVKVAFGIDCIDLHFLTRQMRTWPSTCTWNFQAHRDREGELIFLIRLLDSLAPSGEMPWQ